MNNANQSPRPATSTDAAEMARDEWGLNEMQQYDYERACEREVFDGELAMHAAYRARIEELAREYDELRRYVDEVAAAADERVTEMSNGLGNQMVENVVLTARLHAANALLRETISYLPVLYQNDECQCLLCDAANGHTDDCLAARIAAHLGDSAE